MEASNAGMYDVSTAAAEAALMSCRVTDRDKVALLTTVNPRYRQVVNTYVEGQDIFLEEVEAGKYEMPADCACLIVQQPNFFGHFEDLTAYAKNAKDAGALLVVVADPISLGMFKPPGEYGADIVVAEGQSLGSPINYGGPGLGIFCCREEYLRRMPGRLVGKTVDTDGNPGYVLTLAAREQHIRRERATSNICTNEALVALATTVYLATLGKTSLRKVAELCYHKAHYAADAISKLKGYSLAFSEPFFKEFVVRCPIPPAKINEALFKEKIIGGLDVSDAVEHGMLLCVTEMNTKNEIDRLVEALGSMRK
jgi:glycine dehydrogenase subunit 1